MKLEDYFDQFASDDIRIRGTRIGIESVLYEYIYREQSPEAIQTRFSSLTLEQVYATILYYLHEKEKITDYTKTFPVFYGIFFARMLYSVRISKFQEDSMNLYDCIFSENDIKQLQDCRDRQKDAEPKLKIIEILSNLYSNSGVKAAIGQTAEIFGKHTVTVKNRLRRYLTGGAEKPGPFNCETEQSYLNPYRINHVVISITYENHATDREIRNYIGEKFSTTCSVGAVGKLLIKKRLKVIRPRTVPGNPPDR